eukprot:jgi/Psemu1/1698/gm1.1698_g
MPRFSPTIHIDRGQVIILEGTDSLSGEEATTTSSEKDKDPYFEPATYANVFRASRTARNQTFNVAYFINSGSLDGDYVLRQLLHVVAALECVGFKVMMQMLDAGGVNTSALALLTSNNCKCCIQKSTSTLKINLCTILFSTWTQTQQEHVSIQAQNVNDAKKAFEEETISYQCQWLANKIGCTPDFFDKLLEEFKNKDECGDEILEGKAQLLKDKLSTLPSRSNRREVLVKYAESKMTKEQGKKKHLDVGDKVDNDSDVTANAKDDILKNDELLEVFLDCSKGDIYLGKLSEKKKIFAELVDKVINARFSEEIRVYREEHTAREAKYKGTNLTMREKIDVIGSRKRASSNNDAGRSIEERKEE